MVSALSESSPEVESLFHALTEASFTLLFSKKVLVRPPFPFLHKLCVEALASTSVFTPAQLSLPNLVDREQKAGFLVRALAIVTFALRRAGHDCVSVLLLVSPVQVLAGTEVDRTHEFLRQLVHVHRLDNISIKNAATADVLARGESHLYTMAMKFRRGLVKAQASVRLFLGQRRAAASMEKPVAGTRFLKDFDGFGTFEGLVRSVSDDGIYVVYYAQDDDEEELDEAEMMDVMAKSRALQAGRAVPPPKEERMSLQVMTEMVPTNLFGKLEGDLPSRRLQNLENEAERVHTAREHAERQYVERMHSARCATKDEKSPPARGQVEHAAAQRETLLTRGSRRGSFSREVMVASSQPPVEANDNNASTTIGRDGSSHAATDTHETPPLGSEPPWRAKLLALINPDALPSVIQATAAPRSTFSHNPLALAPPTLPKIAVPGGQAKWTKRLKQPKPEPPKKVATNQKTSPPKGASTSPVSAAAVAARSSMRQSKRTNDNDDETPFQDYLAEQRMHQTKVLRAIVARIDKYLKRKRMRVIDLFRYCDFDNCGFISRAGMEEVLRQMDIRLPAAEMDAFMLYLDKNKNGVVDVDEFESLVRVNRRTDARRDQLRHELPHVARAANGRPDLHKLLPYKDQIRRLTRSLDTDSSGTVSAAALGRAIASLNMAKVKEDDIEGFLHACRPVHGLIMLSDVDTTLDRTHDSPKAKAKKENRFLDHTWLSQFDAQMEKVRGLGG
ncbi:Aste57867_11089 [Aphanomyces stellatus]|uniref:Aste57867_11089 protein n=1 Tax=Aphanomyces stellatus TaxID=120398 RepID=A0A485KTV6_9STRA|nr:hypothetical protein As57867_011047 [Aphanomyces stellatus]VFT87956.1 Aste57867_11089 [Aphanomyces stellatus]